MQWDPKSEEVVYKLNLTATTEGKYGAFQDVEQDPDGNVFVVGTYPSNILKVDKNGKSITPWYVLKSNVTTIAGLAGLAGLAAKDWILLSNDTTAGQIVRSDMHAPKGTPIAVPLSPSHILGSSDAIYLPPKYSGTVLLVAEDLNGISVLRSEDRKWEAAEYLGTVIWNVTDVPATAAVQIGDSLYMVLEFFDTPVAGGTSGNKTQFPFVDITQEVESLLQK